jgi:hypothetical protein
VVAALFISSLKFFIVNDIKETIDKFSAQLIEAKETFEGELATKEEKQVIVDACSAIVRKFAGLQAKHRNFFHYKWDYEYQGRQFGFSYLSHYISALFVELARKRYEPISKKNMSAVMTIAHSYKRNGKELSAAMTKAYTVVDRTGSLKTESIQEECNVISNSCILGLWNTKMPSYPSLNKGLNGLDDNARPKAKAVMLVADILGPLCAMIGYR